MRKGPKLSWNYFFGGFLIGLGLEIIVSQFQQDKLKTTWSEAIINEAETITHGDSTRE